MALGGADLRPASPVRHDPRFTRLTYLTGPDPRTGLACSRRAWIAFRRRAPRSCNDVQCRVPACAQTRAAMARIRARRRHAMQHVKTSGGMMNDAVLVCIPKMSARTYASAAHCAGTQCCTSSLSYAYHHYLTHLQLILSQAAACDGIFFKKK